MPTDQAQEFLFQRIKELMPSDASMVDAISEILHVSTDSAYRRIRGETPLVLDEVRQLCHHFNLSLDQLLKVKGSSVLFQDFHIRPSQYTYQQFLQGLLSQLDGISSSTGENINRGRNPIYRSIYGQYISADRLLDL